MIVNTLKIRKEKFGWIACDINNCRVFEISDIVAYVINKLRFQSALNDEFIDKLGQQVSLKFNINKQISKQKIHNVLYELKQKKWIKNEIYSC